MVGKFQLKLGADQFSTGMATSDFSNDGALSPSSVTLNAFLTPGSLRPTATPTDKSTNVAGTMIASSEDSQATSPNNRIMVDDAANIYSITSGNPTKQLTGAKTYSFGISDMVAFAGYNYASSTTHLAQINTSAFTWTEAYKTFNDASAHHPLVVFEQLLFMGDGNLLKYMDSGGTVTTLWTLNSNEKIVSLAIDPNTGLMMVSCQVSYNPTDSIQNRGIVYYSDGYSPKSRKKVFVDDMVCGMYPHEGTVYVGYGNNVGYWTGAGVKFLRKLKNVTFTTGELPYKHHFSHNGKVLFVVDGVDILSYSEVVAGQRKAWFPFSTNPVNTNKLGAIFNLGSGVIGMGFSSSKLYSVDITSTSNTCSGTVFFNNIYFERPVFIRRVRFITTGVTGPNSSAIAAVLADERGNGVFASNASRIWNVPSGVTQYVFDIDYTSAKIQGGQLSFSMNNQNFGVVLVIFYYDIAE